MDVMQLPTNEALFGSFFLLSNRLETVSNRYLGELTTKQWFLLAIVTSFYQEPPMLTEIARDMQLSHQNIKKIALKLEEKGFAYLTKDDQDKRAMRFCVTEQTYQYGNEMEGMQNQFLNAFFAGVSEAEKVQCLQLLVKLLNNLSEIEQEEK